MKLLKSKLLCTTFVTVVVTISGVANALPTSPTHLHIDPVGVGACHKVTGNWLPPNGSGPGTFTGWLGHPCPQPRPNQGRPFPSIQTTVGDTTFVETREGQFEAISPFDHPPGSNFLNTVNHNLVDFNGDEMPNTQPSALGSSDYMLHDGPVTKVAINPTNPAEDLDTIIDALEKKAKYGKNDYVFVKLSDLEFALDILEGNPINDRAYSGFPLLHYNGPNKLGVVQPIYADFPPGYKIGGNLDIDMIYYDQHIESSVSLIDPSAVLDVPWTITYHVNILNGGLEDFSPMTMHFDRNPNDTVGPMHASMDQSYFPMLDEGNEYTVKIKESLGKYYNLTYTWGWRIHPPRVQVSENATKIAGGMTLLQQEENVFGVDPMGSRENQLAAIAMIGDMSPAKRMWNMFNTLESMKESKHPRVKVKHQDLVALSADLRAAYLDWVDRTKLPTGVEVDPDATLTLFYVNNTIYGSRQGISGTGLTGDDSGQGPAAFKGTCNGCAHDWNKRPYTYKVTLYNGDNFPHGYMNVDFGGQRGWENQFQDTDPTTALSAEIHSEPTFIEGSRFDVIDDVLLDTTANPGKQAMRNVPDTINSGMGVDIIAGDSVEYGLNEVITNDRVFPINTGGTEEFLNPTPRELNPDGSINDNAEQQFGSGCFFTFGRNYAWPNAGGPWGGIIVPPVSAEGVAGMHKVEIIYNFEPSRRLKIYQFDPLHHDVAVYSMH